MGALIAIICRETLRREYVGDALATPLVEGRSLRCGLDSVSRVFVPASATRALRDTFGSFSLASSAATLLVLR